MVIHPLFLLVGVASAFTGRLLVLLAAVFAALEHECAHAFAARRLGFRLDKVVLMPYGAVISGDISGISPKEELCVLAAGPLANAFTALAFTALWWLFPETYPYTDVAARISWSLFFVNLLPAFPLDGGRILRVFLERFGRKRAALICRITGIAASVCLAGCFVYSCFSKPNFGMLLFAVLLFAGGFGGGKYGRLQFAPKNFSRGVEERRIAYSAERTAGEAMRFLRDDKYLVLELFSNGEFAGELTEEELLKILQEGGYERQLKEFLSF